MARGSGRVIIPGDGPPCPTCHRPMQIREHRRITPGLLAKPYYFRRWYLCTHRDCKTKLVMRDEFKVAPSAASRAIG